MKTFFGRDPIGPTRFVWLAVVGSLALSLSGSSRAQFVLQPGATGQIQMYVENMGPPQPGRGAFRFERCRSSAAAGHR